MFGSDSGFERHRITTTGQPGWDAEYDWRCATPDELRAKGWFQDARGWWRQPKENSAGRSRLDAVSGRRDGARTDFQAQVALRDAGAA
jgi:hypothetical protein